ncbi:MAG: UDP-N-acetylmuramate dehydrogenase [Clostridia bacterium]|nr:UDP-N-acetylmuramate dehydrogenase [Clostridia bacterium]
MAYSDFANFLNSKKIEYKINEPLKKHTSFKIGGNADYFVLVKSKTELILILKELNAKKIPFFIIGKGSNLLVSDKGIEGVVISLAKLDNITLYGNILKAEAGANLAAVCLKAQGFGLTGLEFAYGIPGSVGGALFMNAGAYGGEMSQVVVSAEYVTFSGELGIINLSDMKLGYRTSIFKEGKMVITSVSFGLKNGDKTEILTAMEDFLGRRKSKQPLEYPSAGSTFKRPEGYFAGALIEKNDLKGKTVGGAMVSEKHAGFIINFNNATSEDVRKLISNVQETVFKADGVMLETEVIFVGKE